MAKCFYNRTRGPLSVTLPDGSSTLIGPKKKLPIPRGMTASLSALLRKGDLVITGYDDDEEAPETMEATPEAVAPAPPSLPATAAEPATAPAPE
jgi:hypothetical protein